MGMRRASSVDFHRNDDKFFGITLMGNYTAEHEWGIEKIERTFGIVHNTKIDGVKRYQIQSLPETVNNQSLQLMLMTSGDEALLASFSPFRIVKPDLTKNFLEGCDLGYNDKNAASWNSEEFAVHTKENDVLQNMRDLFQAFLDKDVSIWVGASPNPFDRGGLNICITSLFPAEFNKQIVESHKAERKLQRAFAKSGVAEKIKAAGKTHKVYPRFKGKELEFYLGYSMDANSGYFTLADINNWLDNNKGPIVEKKK